MKIILTIFLLTLTYFSFCQTKSFKQRSNHIVTIGITNSMFWNNIDGVNDVANYNKKQFIPGIELFGYLYSFEINSKFEAKIGYNHISSIRNSIRYFGYSSTYSSGNPHFSVFLDYKPFKLNNIIFEGGLKIAYFPYPNVWKSEYKATELTPAVTMSETTVSGINPMISFGIGKRCTLLKKYRLDWFFTYNHGTKSLRSYQLIRYDPYIESNLKAYNHHLTFTIRYYFKKYNQDVE